jgi:hypothetical protein
MSFGGNVITSANDVNFHNTTNSSIIGNTINAAYLFNITTNSNMISIGNRNHGATIPLLPDTLSSVSGTATFSNGQITVTNSALVAKSRLSITQHADGIIANIGNGVSYTVINGAVSFTSSNPLSNNSFDWCVTSTP